MGYRAKFLGAKKIDLEEGYWVKIQPLDKDQEDLCQAALFGTSVFEGEMTDLAAIKAQLNHKAYADKQLAVAIVEWNLDDDDTGALIPITEESVKHLSPRHANKILAEVRLLNNPFVELNKTALG
jgi:hypothetical protein